MKNLFRRGALIVFASLVGVLSISMAASAQQGSGSAPAVAPAAAPALPGAPDDVATPPADAQKTDSGLIMKVISPGTGTVHPGLGDRITINYTGWTAQGRAFDSTVARNKPSTFPLANLMPGWKEGIPFMVVGEKRRFWLPEKLAFNGAAGKPAGTLCFDVELLDVQQAPTIDELKNPPKDATKTKSGLISKIIKPGTGTEHPKATSTVTVHYSGWTTDGKMFDSSVGRGQPATFPLDHVIKGWTEGVQLMVVGEKRRFWIPGKLAYDGVPDRPQGTLIFDVELLKIDK